MTVVNPNASASGPSRYYLRAKYMSGRTKVKLFDSREEACKAMSWLVATSPNCVEARLYEMIEKFSRGFKEDSDV